MRSLTEDNCLSLCYQAITVVSSQKKRQYIQKELIDSREQWAMYARQHSQILLQATSSNACEAWHSRLKNGAGQKKGDTSTHGIFGCVRTVHDCAHEVENNVRYAEIESRTKQVTLIKTPGYSGLQRFPYSIQKIVATEHSKLNIRLEQHIPVPVRERVDGLFVCNCLFSRRYQLPCQHVFHIDQSYRADLTSSTESEAPPLSDSIWNRYLLKFGTGGMEMYESVGSSNSDKEGIDSYLKPDPEKTSRVLKLGELNEHIRSVFYKLEEENSQLSSEFILAIENHLLTSPLHSLISGPPIESLPKYVLNGSRPVCRKILIFI